jgi:hypothetical protein
MKKIFLVLTFLFLLPMPSNAVEKVTFDHSSDKSSIQSIDVAGGSYFEVEIINTCADEFEAKSTGLEIKKGETKKSPDRVGRTNKFHMKDYLLEKSKCVIGEPILLKIPHDPKYGGYRIDIVRKKDKTPDTLTTIKYKNDQSMKTIDAELDKICNEGGDKDKQMKYIEENITDLNKISPSYFIVQVNESPWHFDFAGGFTVSLLTNKKYATDSDNMVYRNESAEDSTSLGVAGFLHTYNDKWTLYDVTFVPLSLGLGVTSDSKASYFIGPSIKMGDAFFTAGWNVGPTKDLPAGVKEGSHVTNANTLSNLDTRTGGGVFFAFSYTFLGSGKSLFQKPFATSTDTATTK